MRNFKNKAFELYYLLKDYCQEYFVNRCMGKFFITYFLALFLYLALDFIGLDKNINIIDSIAEATKLFGLGIISALVIFEFGNSIETVNKNRYKNKN